MNSSILKLLFVISVMLIPFIMCFSVFSNNKTTNNDADSFFRDIKESDYYFDRWRGLREKRELTPVKYIDGLSFEEFKNIVNDKISKIERINTVNIYNNATIECNIMSKTGLTDWNFTLDFNDWGHITGVFWHFQDNDNSTLPVYVGKLISGEIHNFYSSNGTYLENFSDYAEYSYDFDHMKEKPYLGLLRQIKNGYFFKQCTLSHSKNRMINEHLDVVLGMLKKDGFHNFVLTPKYDVDDSSYSYVNEVSSISISGKQAFTAGDQFSHTTKIEITYHDKKRIIVLEKELKGFAKKNYNVVLGQLSNMGFTNLYSRKIKDLKFGLFVKNDSLEKLLISDGNTERRMVANFPYPYDAEIIAEYHTYINS